VGDSVAHRHGAAVAPERPRLVADLDGQRGRAEGVDAGGGEGAVTVEQGRELLGEELVWGEKADVGVRAGAAVEGGGHAPHVCTVPRNMQGYPCMTFSTAPDGTVYRDLNGNGEMDPYEDPRRPVAERVRDLLSRMTVEEKAGLLFQRQVEIGPDGGLVEEDTIFLPQGTTHAIEELHLTHVYALLQPKDAAAIARWHNRLQQVAESTRLGIPITLSSDPVHADVH